MYSMKINLNGGIMWSSTQLVTQLMEMGIQSGDTLLMHTSLRLLGDVRDRSSTLLNSILKVIGEDGTLMVPTFTTSCADSTESITDDSERNALRMLTPSFNRETTPSDVHLTGYFSEEVRNHAASKRSDHPIYSFASIGAQSEFLTQSSPLSYPLGSSGPLHKLHQIDGKVLLIGVDQTVNISLRLAEIWAQCPYIHRSIEAKSADNRWIKVEGVLQCRNGFERISPLLRNSRILKSGRLGDADCFIMSQRMLVSMGVAVLAGDPSAILCRNEACSGCMQAWKMCRETTV